MSHVYLISGELVGGGSIGSRHIDLTAVQNTNVIGTLHLTYVARRSLTLTKIVNANSIGNVTLSHITVRTLTLTKITNANAIGSLILAAIPFVPANSETTDLLNASDQTYTTSEKIQIDTLISALKTAGVWAKFDWYGNAYWAKSEHDALLNWMNLAQALVKVGSASWTLGAGLSGVNPVTGNSRYKSGWNVGDGAHSSATNFAFFSKITAISAPQNGMQPMGVWKRLIGGGPSTPDGVFLDLDILANTGFAGAFLMNGNGNTSLVPGDGLGVWGVSHNGGSQITVKNGSTQETDAVSGSADYTDPDGMSVAGSAGLAKRSFPGTQLYWGWGGALSASEFAAIEAAFQAAIAPPTVELLSDALLIESGNVNKGLYVNVSNDYLKVTGAAVATQVAPSYANVGGTGDRRSNVILSWDATINSPNKKPYDLLDGTTSSTASGLFWDTSSAAAEFIVDFVALGKTQLITEFRWHQSNSNTHGIWQVAGSDDGITWTDIDRPFTLGGALVQIQPLDNNISYRLYRWKKIDGSTSNGPFLHEIEFKLGEHRTISATAPTYSTNAPGAITCTGTATGGLFQAGVAANLVNGNTTENITFFHSGKTDAVITFDFGSAVVVTEVKFYQDGTGQHGSWKWQRSPDGTNWTDLTKLAYIFDGNPTPQLHLAFSGNTQAFRYYRAVQVSGTTNSGPWTREFEFRKA